MRTRVSNRTKSFAVEKYDFDASSEGEPEETPVNRRQKRAEEDDENFGDGAPAVESPDEENESEGLDSEAAESDASASAAEPEERNKSSRQKVKRRKPVTTRAVGAPNGHLPVEPAPPEGSSGKSYAGPFDRTLRKLALVSAWYGALPEGMDIGEAMLDRWMGWPLLPPKETGPFERSIWVPEVEEKEAYFAERMAERVKGDSLRPDTFALTPEEAVPYWLSDRSLRVLMGPRSGGRDVPFKAGDGYAVSQTGLPFDEDEGDARIPTGWVLDTGGLPLGLDWKPDKDDGAQVLAVAVIPHSDQESYNYEEKSTNPDFQRHGTVQLWDFTGDKAGDGVVRPSTQRPTLLGTLCLEHGRARRLKWSPVGGRLAILNGDGSICVVRPGDEAYGAYEKLHDDVITLQLTNEAGVKATAMTWVNINRLATGYSDGSIALWSILPTHLLSRHPIHHNDVVDMVSGYPTMPYLIASVPTGGYAKLIDLQAPSYETTEVENALIRVQPNLLAYSDHLLGFFTLYPSSSTLNTTLAFVHHSQFPVVRRLFTSDCMLTSLAVGRTHPFLLVGASDGSLWALNPQVEIFNKRREPSERIRILQHEHRPKSLFPATSPAAERGASRLLQGFARDKNPVKVLTRVMGKGAKKPKKKKGEADGDEDETADLADPSRGVVHEPLTRIVAVEWNPNGQYGCWAAVAMGSGLVRVMDLGLEVPPDR